MKELLDYIIKNLTNGDKYEILESEDNGRLVYTIKVDKDFMGVLIGKSGRTIKAIRNIAKIKAVLDKISVRIDLVEN